MGLVDRAKRIVSRLLTGVEADCGGGTGGAWAAVRRPPAASVLSHCMPCTALSTPLVGLCAGEGKRVVRLARLPTRIFADGSIARGVASEGLYGLARLVSGAVEALRESAAMAVCGAALRGQCQQQSVKGSNSHARSADHPRG